MQRDIIVYFGIIQYEYNNAMCRHAEGIQKIIKELGYKAIVIGVSPNVPKGSYKTIDNEKYAVREPNNICERIRECITAVDIERVIEHIGTQRIKAFIMADYRYLPMKRMKRFCEQEGINFVVDIMDRFVAGDSIASKIKKIDCDLRMKYLYPRVIRKIYICSSYNELLGKGSHTAVIPGVTWDKHLPVELKETHIVLTFLGRPGIRCDKEKIDWVIKSLYDAELTNRFILNLGGFSESEFKINNPDIVRYLSNNIRFLGRLSKEECLRVLDDSDFSIVIRPDNQLSKYGLSTKIGESFSRSVPIFATDTSDNSKYITNGINGFVCRCSYEEVKRTIIHISKLDKSEIEMMRKNIYSNNPLDYSYYVDSFKKVVIS